MHQKIIVIGNVGKKPEVRHLESDSVVANFSIAATERYKNRQGDKVEHTEWFRCEAWRGLAKVIEDYVDKGSLLYIEGRQRTDTYKDKETGQERRSQKIIVDTMKMLSRSSEPKETSSDPEADFEKARQKEAESRTPPQEAPFPGEEPPDDLPF